jgi:hypothetical protein
LSVSGATGCTSGIICPIKESRRTPHARVAAHSGSILIDFLVFVVSAGFESYSEYWVKDHNPAFFRHGAQYELTERARAKLFTTSFLLVSN